MSCEDEYGTKKSCRDFLVEYRSNLEDERQSIKHNQIVKKS